MKRPLLAGCILLLPVLITLLILWWLLELITAPLLAPSHTLILWMVRDLPALHWLQGPVVVGFIARLISLVLLLGLISISGLIGEGWGRRWLLHLSHRLFLAIPIANKIYSAVRDVVQVLGRKERPPELYQVVLTPFPLPDTYVLAIASGSLCLEDGRRFTCLVTPPVPIPHHCFILLAPPSKFQPVDISIEQTLRLIVTAGTVLPESNHLIAK